MQMNGKGRKEEKKVPKEPFKIEISIPLKHLYFFMMVGHGNYVGIFWIELSLRTTERLSNVSFTVNLTSISNLVFPQSFIFPFKFRTDLSSHHERLRSRLILKAYFLLHAVFWSTQFVYERGIWSSCMTLREQNQLQDGGKVYHKNIISCMVKQNRCFKIRRKMKCGAFCHLYLFAGFYKQWLIFHPPYLVEATSVCCKHSPWWNEKFPSFLVLQQKAS